MSNRLELPATRWRQILRRQRASGVSAARFCRERGLPLSSFYFWRRRLREATLPPASFVEVKRAAEGDADVDLNDSMPGPTSAIELVVGRRRVLVRGGFDRRVLVDLLGVLERLS